MSRLIPLRLIVLLAACLLLAAVPLIWQARHREPASAGQNTRSDQPTLVFEEALPSFEDGQADVYIYLEATATVEHRYTNATATTDVLIHQATQTRQAQLAATATIQAWVNAPQ